MYCPHCQTISAYEEEAKCLVCNSPLLLSVDDLLGKSPVRIVKEMRPAQVDLARAVEAAILTHKPLTAEAGTGTGKSFALLLPAILSGKVVVVSTATTLLQHQYISKDLPYLAAALAKFNIPVRYAAIKGRAHYLCLKQYMAQEGRLKPCKKVEDWVSEVRNGVGYGDKLELGSDVPDYWHLINAEDCPGASGCRKSSRCGYARAKQELRGAQVIVANHSIVGFNIRTNMRLLPTHQIYLIDEAHQAESYLRDALSSEMTGRTVANLRRYLDETDTVANEECNKALDECEERSNAMFARLSGGLPGEQRILDPNEVSADVAAMADCLAVVQAPLTREFNWRQSQGKLKEEDVDLDPETIAVCKKLQGSADNQVKTLRDVDSGTLMVALRKLDRFVNNLAGISDPNKDNRVLYVETPKRGSPKLVNAPVFINNLLRNTLFSQIPTVIASSATLTIMNKFDYFKEALGFPETTTEFLATSPFDYDRHSLLYLPKDAPIHPSRQKGGVADMQGALEAYYSALTDKIVTLLRLSKGHAFVLFSARREMEEIHRRVSEELDFPMKLQEEGVSTGSLEVWFRNTKNAVLFGVKSFWEGISIEGDQLRLVIITKVPFPLQGDPVYKAKKEALKAKGVDPFPILDIPAMIMDVKQGTGRLIRTMVDRGVCAILDGKVCREHQRRGAYAFLLINSLPFPLVDNIELVSQFLAHFEE